MKIVKIRLALQTVDGKNKRIYPSWYDAEKINVIAREEVGAMAAIIERGTVDEYCIALIDDAIYAAELLKEDDAEEVTREQARVIGRSFLPIQNKILHERNVLIVIEKILNNVTIKEQLIGLLNADEFSAIDPNNKILGINKVDVFGARLLKYTGAL